MLLLFWQRVNPVNPVKITPNFDSNAHVRPIIEARTFSYQQIHAHKPLFGNQGRLLDLGHLYFDIVSDLELRISDFASLGFFTLVKSPLQISSFVQNKPNFQDVQMNVNSILTKDYERNDIFAVPENKANSNPIKANTKPIPQRDTQYAIRDTRYKPNLKTLPQRPISGFSRRFCRFGPRK